MILEVERRVWLVLLDHFEGLDCFGDDLASEGMLAVCTSRPDPSRVPRGQ
jgi:hypothetical protein